jgi:hypothetical protein
MRITVVITSIFLSLQLSAQYGGSYTYAYLDLPPSARIAGLSGLNITTWDEDVNIAMQNPALLNPLMDGRFSVSNAFIPAIINSGSIAYAKYADNMHATFGGALLYRAYGTFEMTDVNGDRLGSFTAGEYALQWGASYGVNKLHYGANAKLLYSQLESYNSFGVAADLGAAFIDTAQRFIMSLVFRNIGTQIDPFVEGNREELPFQIDFGISKRLAHLPLRISFTFHDLQTFDIRYDDPDFQSNVNIFGADSTVEEKNYTVDKIARHLNVAGEFYFGKSVMARVGYDHMRRKELSLATRRGMTGFSLGFGIKINRFYLDYAHEFYSIAGGNHMITLGTNFNHW